MSALALLVALAGAAPVPHLRQQGPSCLATAAAAVLQSKGVDITPRALQRTLPVSRQGVRWVDLQKELRRQGFHVVLRQPRQPLRQLVQQDAPLLVSQTGTGADHAIVLERATASSFVVMDPANPGLRELPMEQVEASFDRSGRWVLSFSSGERQ